jgi:hypothetical protein
MRRVIYDDTAECRYIREIVMDSIATIVPFAVLALVGILYLGAIFAWRHDRKRRPVRVDEFGGFYGGPGDGGGDCDGGSGDCS